MFAKIQYIMRKTDLFIFFIFFLTEMLHISILSLTFAREFENIGYRTCSSVG